jgi:hypothetical protein
MTASRPTHFAHIDGTVSTRNSKTRVYAWAVEERRDLHAEARELEAQVVKLEEKLAAFERAVDLNQVVRKTKPWSFPAGASYREFYLEDPSGGERIWIGSQVVDADGKPVHEEDAFDYAVEIVKHREGLLKNIASTRQTAQELADGPRYSYSIVRWSERRDSAFKALSTFQRKTATYTLVEAQEGKAPAKVEAPAPVKKSALPNVPVEHCQECGKLANLKKHTCEPAAPIEAPAVDLSDVPAEVVKAIRLEAAKELLAMVETAGRANGGGLVMAAHHLAPELDPWADDEEPEEEPELELFDPKGVRLTLGRAGYGGAMVRRGVGFGGYNVVGQAGRGTTSVSVFWRAPDTLPEMDVDTARADMLERYTVALEARGYTVEDTGKSLRVTKRKR